MCLNMHMRKISSVIYSTSIDAKIIKNVYKQTVFFSKHEYFLLRPEYRAINRHFLFLLEFIFKSPPSKQQYRSFFPPKNYKTH